MKIFETLASNCKQFAQNLTITSPCPTLKRLPQQSVGRSSSIKDQKDHPQFLPCEQGAQIYNPPVSVCESVYYILRRSRNLFQWGARGRPYKAKTWAPLLRGKGGTVTGEHIR